CHLPERCAVGLADIENMDRTEHNYTPLLRTVVEFDHANDRSEDRQTPLTAADLAVESPPGPVPRHPGRREPPCFGLGPDQLGVRERVLVKALGYGQRFFPILRRDQLRE